jgi:alcohol dehydrogenase (NADP+)
MIKTTGYAAFSNKEPLRLFKFERRSLQPTDIEIDILYCGVCHSDLHVVKNEWAGTTYPVVPGHEITGRVVGMGGSVERFKSGELVGVGPMVDSCRKCPSCSAHLEQYCDLEAVFTYNSEDKYLKEQKTYGGYSTRIVVDQSFVLKISEKLDPAKAAPLLCAGITTYSPLRHWKVGKGSKVGIVGLGGLGHMGLKFSHALGAHTVLFTTSANKKADALKLGANEVIISNNSEEVKKHASSFDFILNTVAVPHNLDVYLELLKRDGALCMVGLPELPHPSPSIGNLISKRRQLAGSLIGGIKETQEMLDFCAQHQITSDIELIPMQKINEAYERMLKSDVKYRFVIDMASLK